MKKIVNQIRRVNKNNKLKKVNKRLLQLIVNKLKLREQKKILIKNTMPNKPKRMSSNKFLTNSLRNQNDDIGNLICRHSKLLILRIVYFV